MTIHVKNVAQLRQWAALADAQGLPVVAPARPRRRQRDFRADLERAIERSPSGAVRQALTRALERFDAQQTR